MEDALAGRTALTGEVFLTHHPEAAADQTNSADPSVAVGVGVRSAMVVPIYLDGMPVRGADRSEPHGRGRVQRRRTCSACKRWPASRPRRCRQMN